MAGYQRAIGIALAVMQLALERRALREEWRLAWARRQAARRLREVCRWAA